MKTYWVSGGIAPRILDLGSRWRRAVNFTPRTLYLQGRRPWYPLDKRLGRPQNRSGHSSADVNLVAGQLNFISDPNVHYRVHKSPIRFPI